MNKRSLRKRNRKHYKKLFNWCKWPHTYKADSMYLEWKHYFTPTPLTFKLDLLNNNE